MGSSQASCDAATCPVRRAGTAVVSTCSDWHGNEDAGRQLSSRYATLRSAKTPLTRLASLASLSHGRGRQSKILFPLPSWGERGAKRRVRAYVICYRTNEIQRFRYALRDADRGRLAPSAFCGILRRKAHHRLLQLGDPLRYNSLQVLSKTIQEFRFHPVLHLAF